MPTHLESSTFSTLSDWIKTVSSFGESDRSISFSNGHAVSGDRTNVVRLDDPRKDTLVSSGGASFTSSDANESVTEGLHVTWIYSIAKSKHIEWQC